MSFQPQSQEFTVIVRDESVPRSDVVEALLKLASNKLTAKDLIAERVRAECDAKLLDRLGERVVRLVTPGKKEQALNGPGTLRAADPDRQINIALAAFEANGFVLLVDDRQVEDLKEQIEIQEDTVVTFLKLTPLKGG